MSWRTQRDLLLWPHHSAHLPPIRGVPASTPQTCCRCWSPPLFHLSWVVRWHNFFLKSVLISVLLSTFRIRKFSLRQTTHPSTSLCRLVCYEAHHYSVVGMTSDDIWRLSVRKSSTWQQGGAKRQVFHQLMRDNGSIWCFSLPDVPGPAEGRMKWRHLWSDLEMQVGEGQKRAGVSRPWVPSQAPQSSLLLWEWGQQGWNHFITAVFATAIRMKALLLRPER